MVAMETETFREAVSRHPMVLALISGDAEEAAGQREAVLAQTGVSGSAPWHLLDIDASESPEIVAMWGLENQLPALLILREEVTLYRSPLAAVEPAELTRIIERAAALDMARVKAEIEEQRRNQAAIFERRVCPTARRGG